MKLTGTKTFSSLNPPDLSTCTKDDIKKYFINSYDLNESLFLGLKDESCFNTCPDRLRLPLVFYFAHTAVVYVNKLMLAGFLKDRINLEFETMFETGVDEMSWDDTENYRMGGSYEWPSISEVMEYRQTARDVILKAIHDTPLTLPIDMDSPWWGIMMGMEHERIHLETSSVLIRQMPIGMVRRPKGWTYGPFKAAKLVGDNKMVTAKATEVTLGKPTDFPSYGWDNEYGVVTCTVPPFEASQYSITNREFLEFVDAGGYQTRDLWTEEGWNWVQFRSAQHPTFWVCDQGCRSGCGSDLKSYSHCQAVDSIAINGSSEQEPKTKKVKKCPFKLRLVFDVVDMPWDWPVECNYHEAKAFCSWKGPGFRLPVEAEHHVMRGPQLLASEGPASDIIFQDKIAANLNFQYGSSTPVNLFAPSKTGFYDVFGNTWEWVEDHFNGLTGFHTHHLYDDFSAPCFDGKHNVILGGSWISTGDQASRFARYAFRRHFFQHAGFRVARSLTEDLKQIDLPARIVETQVFVLGQGVEANKVYLDNNVCFQWVQSTNHMYNFDTLEMLDGILELEFGFRDSFAAVAASLCASYCTHFKVAMDTAMHLGTATGRGSFEMSKYFKSVLGVESCGRLVDAAIKLHAGTSVRYGTDQKVVLEPECNLDRITFKQLTWIPNEVQDHDVVLITHLDRVQNPKAWLIRLWEITRPKGIAVIASNDGKWNRETLHEYLHVRLTCVSSQDIPYGDVSGERTATVTVWKFK